MKIFHSLFWIRDKKITSLLYETDGFNVMKIGGRKAVPFTDTFWSDWNEYAGVCSGYRPVFCLIYDAESLPEKPFFPVQCGQNDGIWSRRKIEEAVRILEITEPVEIRNENGVLLLKAGCFMNVRKEDIVSMTAWYMKGVRDSEAENVSPKKTTTLIEHYKGELKNYKKEYEK